MSKESFHRPVAGAMLLCVWIPSDIPRLSSYRLFRQILFPRLALFDLDSNELSAEWDNGGDLLKDGAICLWSAET